MRAALLGVLLEALVPVRDRDPVAGDLAEAGIRPGSFAHAAAVLGVALHYHAEAWRDERGRLAAVLTLAAGGALWGAIAAAGWASVEELAPLYGDPVSRAALRFWSAAHFPAALAVGLLAGHAPWVPEASSPARWHVVVVLAIGCGWAAPAGAGALSSVLLLAAAGLGDRGRGESPARPRPGGPETPER